ncbi:P-loop containing nucleoside triphosphate hydrolase protein [Mycena epipterygia]|nr:P-loop containing nucleoside triphosphate hydrolase protein [Mycena epipterygia]
MSIWVRRTARTRLCRRDEAFTSLFHSSAPSLWKKKKSATGLSNDLIPSSPSGSIHVAPKASGNATSPSENAPRRRREERPPFIRDPVPHADPKSDVEPAPVARQAGGRNPSFRRRWHSEERSERDLSQRTGKWTASKFGGGRSQGSRMGLLEDRPNSYGLGDGFSRGTGGRAPSWAPSDTDRPPSRSRQPFRVPETGGRDGGRRYDGESRAPPSGSGSFSRRPSFGLRPPDADEDRPSSRRETRFSSSPSSSSRASWTSPSRRNQEDDWSSPRRSAAQESEVEEIDTLAVSKALKNRNQPTVVASATPDSKAKPKIPPPLPPPKERPEVPQFYTPPAALSRVGVPIIVKSDPKTAATTASYSPAALRYDLPAKFSSPPLLPGLLKCLTDVLGGPEAVPTPIQALSLKWVVDPWTMGQENVPAANAEETAVSTETAEENYKEFLLASETGSGKSIAYLLPMLQALKLSEVQRSVEKAPPIASKRALNPRALILAPTHELARQLSGFAKALLHDVKLRVLCASRPNEPTRTPRDRAVAGKGKGNSASRMKTLLSFADDGAMGEFQVKEADLTAGAFPVDIVVGTPMKLMEMVRGRGWERSVEFGGGVTPSVEKTKLEQDDDKEVPEEAADSKERGPKLRRGRDSVPGVGKWRASPDMGLSEVEWVVVDEADVLFDPDFQETTRMLLADIAKARGRTVPFISLPVGLLAPAPPVPTTSEKDKKVKEKEQKPGKIVVKDGPSAITPLNYPFNFLLTSATIPNSLSSYLNAYHPGLKRLVSPKLHHLPKTLKTEHVSWSGGNKNADIERRLRKVWAADAAAGLGPVEDSLGDMSKVLIFCNKNTKVKDLGEFLDEKGIKNIQLSGSSENRKRGSNKHLDGFIKTSAPEVNDRPDDWSSSWVADEEGEEDEEVAPEVAKKKEPVRSLVPILRKDSEPLNDPMNVPHVMITTSLLSRGLDFSPNIKHVFIIDEPRNMIDFLHRAGRTGRAGQQGKVVIFGKLEGRGSQRSKEVRKKVKALLA